MDEMALVSEPFGFDSFSRHDWQVLSTSDEHRVFYRLSSILYPLSSILSMRAVSFAVLHASDIALALVRDVTIHTITAWRQLHHIDYQWMLGRSLSLNRALPIATNRRLWHLDLRRWVADNSNSRSSLIGYNGTRTERPQIDAVVKSSSRACRKIELRSMAALFVLHHDEAIRNATRSAIQQFPDDLPYAYEEQRGDENFMQGLEEAAWTT